MWFLFLVIFLVTLFLALRENYRNGYNDGYAAGSLSIEEKILAKAMDKLGSRDAAVVWYDLIDAGSGKTPRQMVVEGKGEIVLASLDDDWSYS